MSALFAAIVVACGGASDGAGDLSAASGTLSAGETDAAAPTPSTPSPTTPACDADDDCAGKELCVQHVCRAGCRSRYECASGFCNFDNDGHCFNEHGCNPPPAGIMCPMICWGFCDAPSDAG